MRILIACALAVATSTAAPRAGAFANVAVGDPLRDRELPAVGGGKAALLGDARASVFVFFRSDNENSYEALRELSFIEREMAGKSVRFVAVISDADDAEAARAMLARAGLRMPLLLDAKDALYGELGVRLHPVVGIADAKKRLAAYEHFRKVGFRQIVRGRIRLTLGEISAAEMQRIVAPEPSRTGDDHSPARRHVALGRRQLDRGDVTQAEASARKSLALEPAYAPAHALLGKALAAQGKCPEARKEFEEALRLAPGDGAARDGLRTCEGK